MLSDIYIPILSPPHSPTPRQDFTAQFKLALDLLESKTSLRLMVFLPQLPECRDYKCSPQLPGTLYEFLNI